MSFEPRKVEKTGDYSNHLRLVVIGKTGNGKSSTANSLINRKLLKYGPSGSYVTEKCEAVEFELENKKILLVDTPG